MLRRTFSPGSSKPVNCREIDGVIEVGSIAVEGGRRRSKSVGRPMGWPPETPPGSSKPVDCHKVDGVIKIGSSALEADWKLPTDGLRRARPATGISGFAMEARRKRRKREGQHTAARMSLQPGAASSSPDQTRHQRFATSDRKHATRSSERSKRQRGERMVSQGAASKVALIDFVAHVKKKTWCSGSRPCTVEQGLLAWAIGACLGNRPCTEAS
ncbi:hypothetical protein HaLaN_25228 [Haematococcus lacustris]|uniref:Uncharacterized protein n=1 Tax=Haematococcus lacustris TaxID=44745 RepID=A0A699ZWC4_HAELA|nr:hypothetical protein HaLaN_25228 [Haematococcus lacustris]